MFKARKKFADSREELAELITQLGFPVSAKSIQNWLKDPRYEHDCPRPRSGRHNVFEWIGWMVWSGVKRADERVQRDRDPSLEAADEQPGSVIDWKLRREQLMCTQLERAILRDDGKLLVSIDLEIALGQLVAGVSVALDYFAPSAARFVVGLRDIHDVQAKLQSEIDAVKQKINAARYLDDCIGEVATPELIEPLKLALQAIGRRALSNESTARINPVQESGSDLKAKTSRRKSKSRRGAHNSDKIGISHGETSA